MEPDLVEEFLGGGEDSATGAVMLAGGHELAGGRAPGTGTVARPALIHRFRCPLWIVGAGSDGPHV